MQDDKTQDDAALLAIAKPLWIETQRGYLSALSHLHHHVMERLSRLELPADGFWDAADLVAALRANPDLAKRAGAYARDIEDQIENLQKLREDFGHAFDRDLAAAGMKGG